MLSSAKAIREDKPGFHGYGSLSFPSQEKCNARTTLHSYEEAETRPDLQAAVYYSSSVFYLQATEKGGKKKLFLTAWISVGLDSSSALYMFHCTCAVTVLAVWMGRTELLAFTHLSEFHYPLKRVTAEG